MRGAAALQAAQSTQAAASAAALATEPTVADGLNAGTPGTSLPGLVPVGGVPLLSTTGAAINIVQLNSGGKNQLALGSGGTVTLPNGTPGTDQIAISGAGSVTSAGGGVTTTAGSVTTTTGGTLTTTQGGTISLTAGSGSLNVVTATTLTSTLAGTVTLPAGGGTVALAANQAYTAPAGSSVTFSGTGTGTVSVSAVAATSTATVALTGAGTLALANANPTLPGGTITTSSGTTSFTNGGSVSSLAAGSQINIVGSGTINLTGTTDGSATVALPVILPSSSTTVSTFNYTTTGTVLATQSYAIPNSPGYAWKGVGALSQSTGNGLTTDTITQSASEALLYWSSFNVSKNTVLDFDQSAGGANVGTWVAINQIVNDASLAPSQILGSIQASGQVYVINQNGVIFGGSSQVNTHNLTVSSLPINTNLLTPEELLGGASTEDQDLFSQLTISQVTSVANSLPTFTPGNVVTVASSSTNSDTVTLTSATLPTGFAVGSVLLGSTVQGINGTTVTLAANANASDTNTNEAFSNSALGSLVTVASSSTNSKVVTLASPGASPTLGVGSVLLGSTVQSINGTTVTLASNANAAVSNTTEAFSRSASDGDVIVALGAQLTSPTTPEHVGGRIALIAPVVDNEGTISTPDGQTILAAGLQVGFTAHAQSDPSLRGLDVFVGGVGEGTVNVSSSSTTSPTVTLASSAPSDLIVGTEFLGSIVQSIHGNTVTLAGDADATVTSKTSEAYAWSSHSDANGVAFGTVTNGGVIEVPRADVTMAGMDVNQQGIIDSLTSVSLNGRVDLLADYGANPQVSSSNGLTQAVFVPSETGVVTLGSDSVTQILPDTTGATVTGTALALPSLVNIEGLTINLDSGAEILAPGAMATPSSSVNGSPTVGSVDLAGAALTSGVNLDAGTWQTALGAATQSLNSLSVGQVNIDSNATIDVSGSQDVSASVTENIIPVQLRGTELADSPLQQNGPLRGQTVDVNIADSGVYEGVAWIGSPIGDLSGYAALVEHTVNELTVNGGTVGIQAGNSVNIASGSTINVSGGYVNYQGADVATTKVVTATGEVIDISQATPDQIYQGIYTGDVVTSSKWGVSQTYNSETLTTYEPGYIQGGNGGALTISSPSLTLQGNLYGNTVAGQNQVAPAQQVSINLNNNGVAEAETVTGLSQFANADFSADASTASDNFMTQILLPIDATPTAGTLVLNLFPQAVATGHTSTILPEDIVFQPGAGPAVSDPFASSGNTELDLSSNLVGVDGFSYITIYGGDPLSDDYNATSAVPAIAIAGNIAVPAGAVLTTAAGGSLTFASVNMDVEGSILAPSGDLNFTAQNTGVQSSNVDSPLEAAAGRGQFTLGGDASLSTAGLVVDNESISADANILPGAINGGSITIKGYNADLESGTSIDASGGVEVSPTEKITYGKGGKIDIEAGQDPYINSANNYGILGGHLTLGSTLSAYSGTTGGSLTILAPLIQVGGDTLQNGDTSGAPVQETASVWGNGTTLWLDKTGSPDFFSQGGFNSFTLTGLGLAPVTYTNGIASNADPNASDPGVVLAAGSTGTTLIQPIAQNYQAMVEGDEVDMTTTTYPLASERAAVSLTFDAAGVNAGGVSTPTLSYIVRGNLVMDAGVTIQTDPNANVTLEGQTAAVLGQVYAPGGAITVKGASSSTNLFSPNLSGSNSASDIVATVDLGPNSVLSTAGTAEQTFNSLGYDTGSVLNGGSITVKGNVVAEEGSLLDVSGTSATFDVSPTSAGEPVGTLGSQRMVPLTEESNGGSITFDGGTELFIDSTMIGGAGGANAQPGSLSISSGYTNYNVSSSKLQSSLDPTLFVMAGGSTLAASPLTGEAVIGQESVANTSVSVASSSTTSSTVTLDSATLPAGFEVGSVLLGSTVKSINGTTVTLAANANASVSNQTEYYTAIDSAGNYILGYFAANSNLFLAAGADPSLVNNGGRAGGFGSLTLNGTVQFSGPVSIATSKELIVATGPAPSNTDVTSGGVIYGDGTSNVTLSSSYVDLGLAFADPGGPDLTSAVVAGAGIVTVNATQLLDVGNLSVENMNGVNLVSSGDVRGDGSLNAAGSISITAAQIYPTTENAFTIAAYDSLAGVSSVALATPSGTLPSLPLSAGGTINIYASTITQDGVLRAPMGTINLGSLAPPTGLPATTSVTLGLGNPGSITASGSITSVSAFDPTTLSGITIPYGYTDSSGDWIDPAGNTITAGSTPTLPDKAINLSAASITDITGSTLDVRGGGDLEASQFVSGTGGTNDILDSTTSFAIIPSADQASYAPFDDEENNPRFATTGLQVGSEIYLAGGNGLAAGYYTLLPSGYALLPGAFLVTPESGAPSGTTVTELNGSSLVSGYLASSLNGVRENSLTTVFQVKSQAVINSEAEYIDSSANTYFPQSAISLNVAVPRLPVDAGQVVLNATQSLTLPNTPGTLQTAATGLGSIVDIASPTTINIDNSSDPSTDVAGDLNLDASALSSFEASTLVIGGSQNAAGTTVTVTTNSLTVDTDGAALSANDLILVSNGLLQVDQGSVIESSGSLSTQPLSIVNGNSNVVTVASSSTSSSTVTLASATLPSDFAIGSSLLGSTVQSISGKIVTLAATANARVTNQSEAFSSSDGVLLRVSGDPNAVTTRPDGVNPSDPNPQLIIGGVNTGPAAAAGVSISGASLTLDSTGFSSLDESATLKATSAVSIDSGHISLVLDGSQPANGGLVISGAALATLQESAQTLSLLSYSSLDIWGSGDIGASPDVMGNYQVQNLTLHAAEIRGFNPEGGSIAVASSSTNSSTVTLSSATLPAGFGVGSIFLGSTVQSISGDTVTLASDADTVVSSNTSQAYAGTVDINAQNVVIDNSPNGTGLGPTAGYTPAGSLAINSETLTIGDNPLAIDQYAQITLSASSDIVLSNGTGSLTAAGNLTLSTPLLTAAPVVPLTPLQVYDGEAQPTATNQTISAAGALTISNPNAEAAISTLMEGLGANVTLAGASVMANSTIQLPSGTLAVVATGGDLSVGGNLDVGGTPQAIYSLTEYTSGGRISLTSYTGGVTLSPGASVNVSSSGGNLVSVLSSTITSPNVTLAGGTLPSNFSVGSQLLGSTVQSIDGTTVTLASNANATVSNAAVGYSSPTNGGSAGSLTISAANGTFTFAGSTLLGEGGEGGQGGTFTLEAANLPGTNLSPLEAALNPVVSGAVAGDTYLGGFTQAQTIRVGNGSVTLDGTTATDAFNLSTDAGSITVSGEVASNSGLNNSSGDSTATIDVTTQANSNRVTVLSNPGVSGGSISLEANGSVTLQSGALLSVAAQTVNDAGQGGTVSLEAGDETNGNEPSTSSSRNGSGDFVAGVAVVNVQTGSVIDLSVAATSKMFDGSEINGATGILNVRAPQTTSNLDVQVDPINGNIVNPSSIVVEGYEVFNASADGSIDEQEPNVMANGNTFAGVAGQPATASYTAMLNALISTTGVNSTLQALTTIEPGAEIINTNLDTTANPTAGDLTLASNWDLSTYRFGPSGNVAGDLTLRAGGNLVFEGPSLVNDTDAASLSDGFTTNPTYDDGLWTDVLMPAGSQSWSYRLVAGADFNAANYQQVLPLSSTNSLVVSNPAALSANSGSVLIGLGTPNISTITSSTTTTEQILGPVEDGFDGYYQTIRTGTGSINISSGGDVQLLNNVATIYTAGTQVTPPGTFDAPILTDPSVNDNDNYNFPAIGGTIATAEYSQSGGNVVISAQGNIAHYTQYNPDGSLAIVGNDIDGDPLANDSSLEVPTNWLYRRGDDVGGTFATNADGQVASTTWWVDFNNFFEGVGALGGGNVTLTAGGSVDNVDALVPTNAYMPGVNANGNLVELGGGDLLVSAGGNINGGVYYIERGQATLEAGEQILTNATRSLAISGVVTPQKYLPTTLFLGEGTINISAGENVLLGPIVNPFLLPQGINNTINDASYFSTYASTDAVDVSSLTGEVTIKDATSGGSLLTLYSDDLSNGDVAGNFSTDYNWLGSIEPSIQASTFGDETALMPPTLEVTAFSGSINLDGNLTLSPSASGTINLVAAGSINAFQPVSASTLGQLTWASSQIDLSDANPNSIPGVTTPVTDGSAALTTFDNLFNVSGSTTGSSALLTTQEALHADLPINASNPNILGPLHADDSTPVYLYAGNGDIDGLNLFSGKMADVVAGNDITDTSLYVQNDNSTDITLVEAGHDILPYDANSVLREETHSTGAIDLGENDNSADQSTYQPNGTGLGAPNAGNIQIAGPGTLEVLAGRNLNLGENPGNVLDGTGAIGSGILSIGNTLDPYLPFNGADIIAAAGLGGSSLATTNSGAAGFGLDSTHNSTLDFTSADGTGFIDEYLNPTSGGAEASTYLPDLGSLLGVTNVTDPQIWDIFSGTSDSSLTDQEKSVQAQLTPETRDALALTIFYDVLRDAGRDHNNSSSPFAGTYTEGYAAIAALFPSSNTYQGDITLTSREIKTTNGGNISLLAPGGQLDVGLDNSGTQAIDQGILTVDGGNISIFTNNNVSVGTSRIFTLHGGNEIIWSTLGNIAAGASSKTVQSAPPTRVLIDTQSGNVETDLAGLATGGGIGVLETVLGAPPGNVDLIAPSGIVDAGDAGIRSSGTINIAATQVLNAGNIQSGSGTTGVATVAAPNISATVAAASAGGASQNAATEAARSAQPQNQPQEEDLPSIISVQVISYGEGDDDSASTAPSDSNKKNPTAG